jgi:hypothetical protein
MYRLHSVGDQRNAKIIKSIFAKNRSVAPLAPSLTQDDTHIVGPEIVRVKNKELSQSKVSTAQRDGNSEESICQDTAPNHDGSTPKREVSDQIRND